MPPLIQLHSITSTLNSKLKFSDVKSGTLVYGYLDWIQKIAKEDLCLGKGQVVSPARSFIFYLVAGAALFVSIWLIFFATKEQIQNTMPANFDKYFSK